MAVPTCMFFSNYTVWSLILFFDLLIYWQTRCHWKSKEPLFGQIHFFRKGRLFIPHKPPQHQDDPCTVISNSPVDLVNFRIWCLTNSFTSSGSASSSPISNPHESNAWSRGHSLNRRCSLESAVFFPIFWYCMRMIHVHS